MSICLAPDPGKMRWSRLTQQSCSQRDLKPVTPKAGISAGIKAHFLMELGGSKGSTPPRPVEESVLGIASRGEAGNCRVD